MSDKSTDNFVLLAQNKKAFHDYKIVEKVEAGLVLMGSEVKSLRQGKASIKESHAAEKNGRLYLLNANISEYAAAGHFNHEPRRPRALLLHKKEMDRLLGLVQREGATLIPLSLYFNHRGKVKCQIGLAEGRKKADKREMIKQRDWQRQKARLLKSKS